jgi:hypothetical protein
MFGSQEGEDDVSERDTATKTKRRVPVPPATREQREELEAEREREEEGTGGVEAVRQFAHGGSDSIGSALDALDELEPEDA